MELEKEMELIRNTALASGNLDVVDDELIRISEIYQSVNKEAARISLLPESRLKELESRKMEAWISGDPELVDISGILKLQDTQFVEQAYLRILGRHADPAGLAEHLKKLKQGLTRENLVRAFRLSGEGRKRGVLVTGFTSLSAEELLSFQGEFFVRNAYGEILGRQADPEGLKMYLKKLRDGTLTKEEILYSLQHSEEAKQKNGGIPIAGLEEAYQAQAALRRPVTGKLNRSMRVAQAAGQLAAETLENEKHLRQEIVQLSEQNRRTAAKAERVESFGDEMDELKEQIRYLRMRVAQDQGYISVLEQRLNSVEVDWRAEVEKQKQLDQIGFDVQSNSIALERHGAQMAQLGLNIQNNNILLERYRTELDQMKDDRMDVSRAIMDFSNLSARMTAVEDQLKNGTAAAGPARREETAETAAARGTTVYDKIDYFDFENHFRGSRMIVKKHQEIYLPYFEGKKKVLDLGCGRGEFTELLTEHGIGVTGVDIYGPYVEYMKTRGLPAVQDDAVSYLQKEGSTDGIFLGQVVEHLAVSQIITIFRLAFQKLEAGCFLIMETPNPMSLAIFTGSFYQDPSHEKPVHPYTLQYLAKKAGFRSAELLFPESSRVARKIPELKPGDPDFEAFNEAMFQVSELLYGSQDYALIVRKE